MKKLTMIVSFVLCMSLLAACGTEELKEETSAAIEAYNSAASAYNESIKPYNDAVEQIAKASQDLQGVLDAAQDVINKGEEPFRAKTLKKLKDTLANAGAMKVGVPDSLEEYELLTVPDDATKDALEALREQAASGTEELSSLQVPAIPDVPDYSGIIKEIEDAQAAYKKSIKAMKQVTAPSDKFVMERLQRVDTITAMDAVTEQHDPNGMLNKQGGYIGCIYFTDSQVDRSQLYLEEGGDSVIDAGTDGGGAVEVFKTVEEANARDSYLAGFDGMGAMASGSHYVRGTCLVRTSIYLTASQQQELTKKITKALTAVD